MRAYFWLIIVLFIAAQNAQVALYGWVFKRTDAGQSTAERILSAFQEPLFLGSLVGLSIATAILRLVLFPEAGVARTHVITSAAVVLSFALFSLAFGETQSLSRYVGALVCALGIFLVAR